ncbi:hypothetical protein R1flu_029017 [Riccia fluitans]|uniref:HTH CENPB-type domain-containing protein n=1 Tax=Riccia fluitans TaxID=41844 RepID=A0ABD1XND9_9MARC
MLLTVSEKVGRNRELNNAQRKLICLHKEATSITNRELSVWATEKFQFPVSEMTISRTLKRREQWISDKASPDGKRARKLVCPEVEDATYAWFLAMQDKGVTLTDALVCEAAKRFYSNLDHDSGSKQLVFSHGWLGRFKKRHGIKGYAKHGDIVPVETRQHQIPDQIDAIKAIISDFEPGDIFSMEETGLIYRLEPNKALAAKRTSFLKKTNERITVVLTANMDGSMKLPPLIINKYSKPHALASRNISNPANLGVVWHANRLTWMSITLFEKFLQDFESRMLFAGKKRVLLLMDSAHSHKFSNVEKDLKITVVKFVPATTPGVVQPVDAGLVSCFKAYYRTLLLRHQTNCRMIGKDPRIDVYNAVVLLEKTWRTHVTPITISNSWRYTELSRKRSQPVLMLENLNGSPGHWQPRHSFELNEQLTEISELLEHFVDHTSGMIADMTPQEYVLFEEQNGFAESQEPSEDEIWEASLATDEVEEETDMDGPVENVPPISFNSVQNSLENIAMFLLQQPEDVTDLLQKLRVLDSNLASHHKAAARQRDLAFYG